MKIFHFNLTTTMVMSSDPPVLPIHLALETRMRPSAHVFASCAEDITATTEFGVKSQSCEIDQDKS